MAAAGLAPTPRPPGRALLRIAGVLTQLGCGACLLLGTIGLVLVEQSGTGGVAPVVAWLVAAMAGLVFGGLIYRGGLVSMLVAAAIDTGFGVMLSTLDDVRLRTLLKILPASDIATIGDALHIAGLAIIAAGAFCLLALPQGIRYARWFRDAAATRSAMSTARGFPPPPVPVRGSAYIIPAEDRSASRRRLYMVLGGMAIGVGAGVGVLVSSTHGEAPVVERARTTTAPRAPSITLVQEPGAPSDAGPEAAGAPLDAGAAPGDAGATAPRPVGVTVKPLGTVQDLIDAQRRAVARADRKAFAGLVAAGAFGFGVDADEVADGRDAVAAQLAHDLGVPPHGGFTVESTALSIGEDRGHAWIAEHLEVGAAGSAPRSFAITELAAKLGDSWQIVALHWAHPVDDATVERLAILGRLPAPRPISDRHDGAIDLDRAVRAAFASRAAFVDARSDRTDAFNYGSGGERARGAAIKRIFGKLRAQLRIHDGARVVAGSSWDTQQNAAPWIGWAALNVDFTAPTRAATDVSQTLRVLAILIRDSRGWKIVQTQWSNGGPLY